MNAENDALEMEPEEELTGIMWVNPGLLSEFGGILNEHTVMALFASSPFYNMDCINAGYSSPCVLLTVQLLPK